MSTFFCFDQADIWALPSMERIHTAVEKGSLDTATVFGSDGRGTKNSSGELSLTHILSIRTNPRMNLFPPPPSLILSRNHLCPCIFLTPPAAAQRKWRTECFLLSHLTRTAALDYGGIVTSKRSDRLKALDGNALFSLSSCTSSPVSEAQTLLCILFLNSHALRNYDGSHGNSSFTRPSYRPLSVGRPPCGSTLTRHLNAIKNQ